VLTRDLHFQCLRASQFISLFPFGEKVREICEGHKYLSSISISVIITAVSLLSTVAPYELKTAQKKYHLAGLLFFAVIYLILSVCYGYSFCKYYRELKQGKQGKTPISDILLANTILSLFTTISAISSAVCYATDNIDFELSLWVS
jgi:hypothetical protein